MIIKLIWLFSRTLPSCSPTIMYHPETTYRVQLNKDFTLKHLKKIIPYLKRLGIKTIYASPICNATPGSTHGYDGIDPNSINAEIGSLEELREIAAVLKQYDMGWLQDFVPNHMAFSPRNAWLCDFLEKGKMSFYDAHFDKNPDEPLMAPFLGTSLQEALETETLSLVFSGGKLQFRYFETEYPLNYTAYHDILGHEQFDTLPFSSLREKINVLSQHTIKQEFHDHWQSVLNELNRILSDESLQQVFLEGIHTIGRDPFLLARLADQQFYRLCHWQETDHKINYRRFFTVNSLICIQMQREEVFEQYHRLLLQLVQEGLIQGIRIDHIDGLYDPDAYLEQLRKHVGASVYIVAEKILARDEYLPDRWPIQGSTGYDFLAQVNQVLTNTRSEAVFSDRYREAGGADLPVPTLARQYKQKILQEHMQGELSNLLHTFKAIPDLDASGHVTDEALKDIIAAVLVCCPVYRFYPEALPLPEPERAAFAAWMALVKEQSSVADDAFHFFVNCFMILPQQKTDAYRQGLLHFWRRCMQVSGPLMAKGVEDTLMYNYNRFLAHNEVGDDPGSFGITIDHFHELMQERRDMFPMAMNATATHDTKRGEDSRVRLQLLSAVPEEWWAVAAPCIEDHGTAGNNLDAKDRYFVTQAVYAALLTGEHKGPFAERLKHYLQKAAREAKTRSDWAVPDEQYEEALLQYALHLSDPQQQPGKALYGFLEKQQQAIAVNVLAQLVLKLTCPGVPDIYQGTEWYDFSFVDPDNRRAVDYEAREAMLETFEQQHFDPLSLLQDTTAPGLKMYTLYRLLQLRSACSRLFAEGSYEPLAIDGPCIAFIRRYLDECICVIVPAGGSTDPQLINRVLQHTALQGQWEDVFTGKRVADAAVEADPWPVLVLKRVRQDTTREAGILMPLFSLPSDYGIGNMGKDARSFIDFLSQSGQKIWQLLPLNPLLPENSFSPYASSSAFAWEPVYIDPGQLMAEGLLELQEIAATQLPATDKVDYLKVSGTMKALLEKAWVKFRQGSFATLQHEFSTFKEAEKDWLDDYVLFAVLQQQQAKPWYQWPAALRDRYPETIASVWATEQESLEYQQFLQFLAGRQWRSLKEYAALRHIQLVGDVPFYMSYNSADVWAHRELFALDKEGTMLYVAGVPPDYFSATGQLWGMPVYNWSAMQQQGYAWWLHRLRRNIERYNKIRLDHFRAFYDYWEIPAAAATAVHGSWKKGPQDDLFLLLQQQFPVMPFIAEDLGEIHQGVFDFKDRYGLPGMRVLQFGFSSYDGSLRDLPHNFTPRSVVYTGTHDNNTAVGWYAGLSEKSKDILSAYAGYQVTSENIADVLCTMAYASVAQTAIIPLQDLLGLDDDSRINIPASTDHNWLWRLLPGQLTEELTLKLQARTRLYHR